MNSNRPTLFIIGDQIFLHDHCTYHPNPLCQGYHPAGKIGSPFRVFSDRMQIDNRGNNFKIKAKPTAHSWIEPIEISKASVLSLNPEAFLERKIDVTAQKTGELEFHFIEYHLRYHLSLPLTCEFFYDSPRPEMLNKKGRWFTASSCEIFIADRHVMHVCVPSGFSPEQVLNDVAMTWKSGI